jgi:hypothetical protein
MIFKAFTDQKGIFPVLSEATDEKVSAIWWKILN